MRVHVVSRLAVFAQIAGVTFDRLAFIVADASGVGFYKTAIEDTSGQAFVVVRFDCFKIMDGNACLIADFAQTNTALLAGESQLFAYTRCHLQSLDPGVGLVGLLPQVLTARRLYECVQLPLFLHYTCAAKRCQTFVSQKICVSCFLPPTVVR